MTNFTKTKALKVMLWRVSQETGVSLDELRGHSTRARYVAARRKFITRAAAEGYGCWSIGRAMNRDHTTVLHHLGRLS